MRRTAVIISFLLMLLVAVFFFIHHKREQREGNEDRNFAVEDIASLERIVLTDNKNVQADLRRESDHWKINGKYRAMQPKIETLLETLHKIKVDYPVSRAAWNNVNKELSAKATRVELFKKDEEKPFKVYYVGGNTNDSKGTFMAMELKGKPAGKPYVMSIPGFQGVLDARYFTAEADWRDTGIFDYDMDEIAQITLQYPAHPEFSFHLKTLAKDSFSITPVGNAPKPSAKIYKEGVVKYLSSFTFLNAEAFDNNNPKKDSIINTIPFASVMITDQNANSKQMVVYYMPLNKRSKTQFDPQGIRIPYDLDRYYATINDKQDFVIIQDFVFGKIFRKYQDFLAKN